MTIRINGSVSGRRVDLTIDGVTMAADSTDLRAFVQGLEDGQLSILAHHLRQRMEERGFAWNPRTETPAERQQREAPEQCTNLYCSRSQPHDISPKCPVPPGTSGWKSGGGTGQWNG